MTYKKTKKDISKHEMSSITKAISDYDIRAVHPDKMEEFAEYLVRKLKEQSSDK